MILWLWVGFIALVLGLLVLDLGVFHKDDKVIHTREALVWTGVWISLALLFNLLIYFIYENGWVGTESSALAGKDAAIQFFTGYVIEKSLSLDNIFVIALIFQYFTIPLRFQHRVLFWGILGALIMRGIMIGAGAALIAAFSWMMYLFGGFLVFTAVKMLFSGPGENVHPDDNALVKLVRRTYPVTTELDGHNFFTQINGRRAATPLLLVLLVVESSDVLFAVDSIPAIFAVTRDPFLVFTSNIFAILGLRSLYFALATLLEKFKYLKQSLVFVLGYVGVKMILAHHYPIPAVTSLVIILTILALGVLASAIVAKRGARGASADDADHTGDEPR